MNDWNNQTPIGDTCGSIRCKYFSINGCTHPNSEYCINSSLYWPWQIDYDNMQILTTKRSKPLRGLRAKTGLIDDYLGD